MISRPILLRFQPLRLPLEPDTIKCYQLVPVNPVQSDACPAEPGKNSFHSPACPNDTSRTNEQIISPRGSMETDQASRLKEERQPTLALVPRFSALSAKIGPSTLRVTQRAIRHEREISRKILNRRTTTAHSPNDCNET